MEGATIAWVVRVTISTIELLDNCERCLSGFSEKGTRKRSMNIQSIVENELIEDASAVWF